MKVTFIHNPSAGGGDPGEGESLVASMRAAGHEVEYHSVQENNWPLAVAQPTDLVAVAGGDGGVGQVARLLAGTGQLMTILPCGTANNLAQTLGLTGVPLSGLIAGWSTGRRRLLDIGMAEGPWGQQTFVESLGAGLFAWAMTWIDHLDHPAGRTQKDVEQALLGARQRLNEWLDQCATRPLQVSLDDQELSGEFLLLEAMNIRSIGPRLCLAPHADPGDGLLDVVLVRPDEEEQLRAHFHDRLFDYSPSPALTVQRCSHLRLQVPDGEFHLDDRPWKRGAKPTKPAEREMLQIDVRVIPQALAVLLPGETAAGFRRRCRRDSGFRRNLPGMGTIP